MTKTFLLLAAAAALTGCASLPAPPTALSLTAANSPVSFDGNVSGHPTDLVFVLVPGANPTAPGIALRAGETLRLALPAAFRRNPAVAIASDTDANLVLTKGWPQGAVRLAQQYRVGFDEQAHAMTVTALRDIAPEGANAPGIKAIHLRGRSFLNPAAGTYPISVTLATAAGQPAQRWQGSVTVAAASAGPRLAPTNFHLSPGNQADFQVVPLGQQAPRLLGLLLWAADGTALDGVGVAPRDLSRFPRYTGGLLVRDSNGDGQLDPTSDTVVGGIIGAAPQGATGQQAASPVGVDGKPVLSGQVLRDAAFPGGGQANAGLLPIQFRVGSLPGIYSPTVELTGGNSYQFNIEAVAR